MLNPWTIDLETSAGLVQIFADWQGPGQYRITRPDGFAAMLGSCKTPDEVLIRLANIADRSDWPEAMHGGTVQPYGEP